MQKIMFNDLYGLTQAVIDGRKTMTRRIVPDYVVMDYNEDYDLSGVNMETFIHDHSRYKVGEIVAVAQAYRDIDDYNPSSYEDVALDCGVITSSSHPYSFLRKSAGWTNKMFVRADLMPIKICISDIKAERLQDISEEDCLKEGIIKHYQGSDEYSVFSFINTPVLFGTAQAAFAALIDKVNGKGTWKANPWVYAYGFELIK